MKAQHIFENEPDVDGLRVVRALVRHGRRVARWSCW